MSNENNRANNLLQVVNRVREMNVQKSGRETSSSSSDTSLPPPPPTPNNNNSSSNDKRRMDDDDNAGPSSPQSGGGGSEGSDDCQPLDFSSKKVKKESSSSSEESHGADDEASPERPQSFSNQFQLGENPHFLSQHIQQQQQHPLSGIAFPRTTPSLSVSQLLGSDGQTDPSSSENSPQRRRSPEPNNIQNSPINHQALRALSAAVAANRGLFPQPPNGNGMNNGSSPTPNPYSAMQLIQAAQAALQKQNSGRNCDQQPAAPPQSCAMQAGMGGIPHGLSPAISVGGPGISNPEPSTSAAAAAAASAAAAQLAGASLYELSKVNSESQENYEAFRENMLKQIEATRPKSRRAPSTPKREQNENLMDPHYYQRRRKNNEAAKRSRDARRSKENEIAVRAKFLEKENGELKLQLANIRAEIARLRDEIYPNNNNNNCDSGSHPPPPPPPPPPAPPAPLL